MANLNVDVQGFISTGGRIAHITEANGRIVTVAYSRNYEEGTVQYGATIYRPGDDSWNRKESNQLAVLRATQYPVVIEDSNEWTGRDRKEAVRRAMFAHGCSDRGNR